MTLTQLNAFVLVARLGSVRAAASALGVSESAVSQALTALRQDLGDQLVTRSQVGMTLTPGGTRLLGTASQIVVLGAEAHAAVRAAQGAPEQLRVVATATFAEFVAGAADGGVPPPVRRRGGDHHRGGGVRRARRADREPARRRRASARAVTGEHELPVVSEPIFKYRLVVVGPGGQDRGGRAGQGRDLAGPPGSGAGWSTRPAPIPAATTARLLRRLGVPDSNIGVFPSQTAAWAAAADGAGVAPAIEHLVSHQLRRGELSLVDLPGLPAEECWYVTMLERERRSTAGERAAPVPQHAGGDAADAVAAGGRAAVPLQAPGLRHDLELSPADLVAMPAWFAGFGTWQVPD